MLAPIMFVVIEFDRNSINSDELCDAKKTPFALTFLSEPSDLSHGQSVEKTACFRLVFI